MKKLIFLFAVSLALTGCAANNKLAYNENSAPAALDNFSEADIIDRMTAIKNGMTPKINPNKLYRPAGKADDAPDSGQAAAEQQKQLEDLAARYDSAVIKTNFGDITVKFYAAESPITVNNFMNLAQAGFYNGTKFHRVIKDFMIQGGDPLSKDDDWSNDGQGGPGYQFQDEINGHKLVKGSLAMANSGPNTNGSQFFIVTAQDTSWLDGKHTNFGYVASGLEVVEKIQEVSVNENDHPTEDVIINSIELAAAASGAAAPDQSALGPDATPRVLSEKIDEAAASSTPASGEEEAGDFKLEE
ncbi:MAG: peptidylprolyl isomerase [bacterium]|nr:peptidylprolyl isomerase [bacterium]